MFEFPVPAPWQEAVRDFLLDVMQSEPECCKALQVRSLLEGWRLSTSSNMQCNFILLFPCLQSSKNAEF